MYVDIELSIQTRLHIMRMRDLGPLLSNIRGPGVRTPNSFTEIYQRIPIWFGWEEKYFSQDNFIFQYNLDYPTPARSFTNLLNAF